MLIPRWQQMNLIGMRGWVWTRCARMPGTGNRATPKAIAQSSAFRRRHPRECEDPSGAWVKPRADFFFKARLDCSGQLIPDTTLSFSSARASLARCPSNYPGDSCSDEFDIATTAGATNDSRTATLDPSETVDHEAFHVARRP
jgi:hypothetical protein